MRAHDTPPAGLTSAEAALYLRLVASRKGRLEQEFIPRQEVWAALERWVSPQGEAKPRSKRVFSSTWRRNRLRPSVALGSLRDAGIGIVQIDPGHPSWVNWQRDIPAAGRRGCSCLGDCFAGGFGWPTLTSQPSTF
ncbi:hypothetical protein [Pseudomonas frederiksbergensis]|uniref:hypothetical protein n=1 Tax=Pseudomonas frederiksbergensis TaxID=104087 RepID=UPI003D1D88B7